MNELPDRQELLFFQARWIRRAGAASLLGAFLVTASIVFQRAGLHLPDSSSDADQLVFFHDHSGRLILSSLLQALGFCLFIGPLLFLFRAAQGRAERVRGAFAGLIILGPLAFGAGLALSSVGSSQAADDFHNQAPAVEQHARAQAQAAASQSAAPKGGKGGKSDAAPAKGGRTTTAATKTSATTTTAPSGTATTAAKPKTPDQAASDARESLADHLNRHTGVLVAGGLISTIGVLAMVFGLIYTSLWCMRVGLLTRFWGALGMAFGLFLIIPLFPPVPGLVLWFAAIGLMFIGTWPRPLPPAWGAGVAIPWPRPGEDVGPPPAQPGADGTVEGSGREVSERALPENGAPEAEPPGDTQGQRRKKRKRRS